MNASICKDNKETTSGRWGWLLWWLYWWWSRRWWNYTQKWSGGGALLHLTVVSSWRGTVSPWWTSSHLKAALLDVVKLQAERLYAAYDSSLVTKQTDPDAPDVTEGRDRHGKKPTGNVPWIVFLRLVDSLYAHGGDGIQGCVSCCKEVVFVLAHLDGVQPVTDGDEERVVRQLIWGLGETAGKYKNNGEKRKVKIGLKGRTNVNCFLTSAHRPPDCSDWLWVCPGRTARCWNVDADWPPSASSAASAGAESPGSPQAQGDGSPPQWIKQPERKASQ